MLIDTWSQVLNASFTGLWLGVVGFIPNLVVAIIIFVVGWVIGVVVEMAIAHFMKMIKFDEALQKAGFEDFVKKSGLSLNSGRFLGGLVKYFIIVVFLIASFDVLGLTQVTSFLRDVTLGYLPQLIVALLVLLIGVVVGDVLSRVVMASARAAGLTSASLLGTVSKWAVWVFAVLVALSQMGIAGAFIQTLFTGLVVAVSLALGLSFGLGGQQAAARAIEKVQSQVSHH